MLQENLLEILFDRVPMGIAVFDRDLRLYRCNPTWAEYVDRYTPSSASQVVLGASFYELNPGTEDLFAPIFERVLNGETVRLDGFRAESGGIVSYSDVVLAPLFQRDEIIGFVDVTTDVTERVLAQQTMEQRVQERTHELSMLLEVSRSVASTLDLDDMLSATMERLVNLIGASRACVVLLDDETGELEIRAIQPDRPSVPDERAELVRACRSVMDSSATLYASPNPEKGYLEPGVLFPVRVRGKTVGVLGIIGPRGKAFEPGHLTLFESIADQLGIAVENARLYEHAEQVAIASERNRLARDLHDAVSQTLFSASLIAEVLPRLWERNPDEAQRRLAELRELTRGALAEMRTLLLELRPAVLEESTLGDLLRQLAESVTGRARIPIAVEAEGEHTLSPEVKVALYRIAQEALNNIAKHSGASQSTVALRCAAGRVELNVGDNGRGFNPSSIPPRSLGIGIMRERAEAIGATLAIASDFEAGTEIRVIWTKDE